MKPTKISSKELLQKTDITSIKTLTRWHQRGLIPKPEVGTHPAGRGKMAYWPSWVLGRCLVIRQLIKDGRSLNEVKEQLGSDWAAEEKKWSKKRRSDYDYAEAAKHVLYEQCVDHFIDVVETKMFDVIENTSDTVSVQLTSSMAKLALESVQAGYNPVLVIDGADLNLVPDFMVTQVLANVKDRVQSLVVIPIFDEVVTSFSPSVTDLPSEPTITPVMKACSKEKRVSREINFIPIGKWGFELVVKSTSHQKRRRNK